MSVQWIPSLPLRQWTTRYGGCTMNGVNGFISQRILQLDQSKTIQPWRHWSVKWISFAKIKNFNINCNLWHLSIRISIISSAHNSIRCKSLSFSKLNCVIDERATKHLRIQNNDWSNVDVYQIKYRTCLALDWSFCTCAALSTAATHCFHFAYICCCCISTQQTFVVRWRRHAHFNTILTH